MATLADFLDDANMEDTVDGDLLEDVEALNYDDLYNVSKLQKTQRHTDKYALSVDIENEIVIIRDNNRLKFPELELLVHHPIDYARLVKKIVTASTISGKPLPEKVLQMTIESSKLMGTAGGLSELAKIPACHPTFFEECACGFLTAKSTLGMLTKGIGTNNFSGTVPSKLAASVSVIVCLFVSCIFVDLLVLHVAQTQAQPTTAPHEVGTLNALYEKWGISANQNQWNISGEPCSGAAIDVSITIVHRCR
ncbi:hypothetical protein Patl1_06846 [Pistacia atlantica]|uniref:Uncharacterized protein n=1 Tax=Pistacia atlantica TaxID=434234 RepID=A0ACC1AK05_9ROSI|nr:hypothetical protein Patl1_06846 [Pistacia atlantica]